MACPTTPIDKTRDFRISARFVALYRQFTLHPVRLITTSQASISFRQIPSVLPSHPATCQGSTRGRRLRTTTSWPSAWNARARTVPTCPDPPGMTIFIASSNSFDEPVSEFRPGRKALFVATKDPVPVSRNTVIRTIKPSRRQGPHQTRQLPWQPQFSGDKQRRLALCDDPSSGPSVVRGDVERVQVVGVSPGALGDRSPGGALERGKVEHGAIPHSEKKRRGGVKKPPPAVVKNQVNSRAVR